MLCRTITVQFPSEVHFVLGDDLTTRLPNPADPMIFFFRMTWNKSGYI